MTAEKKLSAPRRRTRAEVQQLVAEFVSNGMRRSDFCRSRGLSFGTLNRHHNTNAAIMLMHAENDFGTTAGTALAAELKRMHKPYVLKIYPPVCLTSDDGHNMLYENIPAWESDVFEFLDQHVKN